eukprot:15457450-Alexandrium_andersonii.AAC.1
MREQVAEAAMRVEELRVAAIEDHHAECKIAAARGEQAELATTEGRRLASEAQAEAERRRAAEEELTALRTQVQAMRGDYQSLLRTLEGEQQRRRLDAQRWEQERAAQKRESASTPLMKEPKAGQSFIEVVDERQTSVTAAARTATQRTSTQTAPCLLYTSDAADDM